uniref:Cytochrome b n=1 Tax=Atractolytocestus huronensis TaxID=507542 RepID=A0A343ESS8_9CEST|nr:cytochrome b [Atractolytocestus huronensis]ASL24614.1 cytochrome b [Atractolytocestus huronensis]
MFSSMRRSFVDLPINFSLGYFWCSGFVLSSLIMLQTISGVILSFVYIAAPGEAFGWVLGETADSFFYWSVRYWHIWGVTFIFILLFVHMGRSLYYSSYSNRSVWNVGFLVYLLLMVEAFLGYVLPWHQMSYWAATVLTTIVSGLPVLGPSLYSYVVGGFSVTGVTLIRVFSLHVCLGFVVIGLLVAHVVLLHQSGSNNSLFSLPGHSDVVYFHSYFTSKDFLSFLSIITVVSLGLWLTPDLVVDPDGYTEANMLLTPASIKPEWYFLAYYAIIRAIESKMGGLIAVTSVLLLMWVPTSNSSCVYDALRQVTFWSATSLFLCLIYLGVCHPVYPYLGICFVCAILFITCLFVFKIGWFVVNR